MKRTPGFAAIAAAALIAGFAINSTLDHLQAAPAVEDCLSVVPDSIVVDGRIVHLACEGTTTTTEVATSTTSTGSTTSLPSATTTTTTPTSTTAPATTTTTTTPATTTTVPNGLAFSESFAALDPAKFTMAHWRNEEAGQLDPTQNGSNIAVTSGQLAITSGMQNYGDSAVRINQPFDFAGRTGTFNAKMSLTSSLQSAAWPRLTLTEDPYAVTSYGDDNAAGQGANRGVDLQFRDSAGCVVIIARTYANRVETDLPQQGGACVSTLSPKVITVKVSNSSVQVLSGSTTIVNYTGLNLGFSRGYWYLDTHNHATAKYDHMQTWTTTWDDVSFDGPALTPLNVATVATIEGRTFTLPAGVTNPRLIFNAQHGQQDASPTLRYSLNGNTTHLVTLTRLPGQTGVYMLSVPVSASELVAGTNTVAFTWTGTTGLPPRVADVQLVW